MCTSVESCNNEESTVVVVVVVNNIMKNLNLRCVQVLSLATMRKARDPPLLLWENLPRKASLGDKIIKIFDIFVFKGIYVIALCSKKFTSLF